MIDNDLLTDSIKSALKVEFLSSIRNFLYSRALYSAAIWGRNIDERNRIIQERDKSLR